MHAHAHTHTHTHAHMHSLAHTFAHTFAQIHIHTYCCCLSSPRQRQNNAASVTLCEQENGHFNEDVTSCSDVQCSADCTPQEIAAGACKLGACCADEQCFITTETRCEDDFDGRYNGDDSYVHTRARARVYACVRVYASTRFLQLSLSLSQTHTHTQTHAHTHVFFSLVVVIDASGCASTRPPGCF